MIQINDEVRVCDEVEYVYLVLLLLRPLYLHFEMIIIYFIIINSI
jgi:hypothetical protein